MTSGTNQINIENSSWSSIGTNRALEAKGSVMVACFGDIWFFGSGEGYNVSESSLNTATPNSNLTLPQPANSSYTLAEGYAVSSSIKNDILRTSPNDAGTIDIQEFSFQTYDWVSLNAAGTKIAQREGHCFVPNVDGSKYYLFGGQANVNQVDTLYGDLYEYDLGTNSWKALKSTAPRSYMACAVVEKALVVWGGQIFSNGSVAGAEPLVFDFAAGDWGSTFHGTQDPSPQPIPAPTNSSTLHLAAIVGGTIGALVLVVIVTVAAIYLLKRQ